MKLSQLLLGLFFCYLLITSSTHGNQIENLEKLIKSRRSKNPPHNTPWSGCLNQDEPRPPFSPVFVESQVGLKESDKIAVLSGQTGPADFDQYGGYVTVDPSAGRALFYYFVEAAENSSCKPLLLWLNGGPGCSSLGYGAMEELGPFRVSTDGETLYSNPYAWNKDSYIFLVKWLERFPEYKTHDFYITGESYAGHYVPQLAYTILSNNNVTNQTVINLKGIAIGNAWIDDQTSFQGMYDYFWTHALISDETITGIHKYCNFVNYTSDCGKYLDQVELGDIDIYNIYAPQCLSRPPKSNSTGSVYNFDPCSDYYVYDYLNRKEVKEAFHARPTSWTFCSGVGWTDSPITVLRVIEQLIASGIRVSIYSGDTDGRVPVTSSRYSVNTYNLPVVTPWRPWYSSDEVGGYVVEYKGLTLTTVRGSGHTVPSFQPERALTMISSFLRAELPPPS